MYAAKLSNLLTKVRDYKWHVKNNYEAEQRKLQAIADVDVGKEIPND